MTVEMKMSTKIESNLETFPIQEKSLTFKELALLQIKTKYLVLSDLHLGAEYAHAGHLLQIIKAIQSDWVIFNGDTFQDNEPQNLSQEDLAVIDAIKALGKPPFERKTAFTYGNHDDELEETMRESIGAKALEDFIDLKVNGIKIRITHGHRADSSHPKDGSLKMLVAGTSDKFARKIKMKGFYDWAGNTIYGLKGKIIEASLKEAEEAKAKIVINGHTHDPEIVVKKGITIINTGFFGSKTPSFATIDEKGLVLYKITSLKI